MITNINNDLVLTIISFVSMCLFYGAPEIITYPRPTANPNASGINTALLAI